MQTLAILCQVSTYDAALAALEAGTHPLLQSAGAAGWDPTDSATGRDLPLSAAASGRTEGDTTQRSPVRWDPAWDLLDEDPLLDPMSEAITSLEQVCFKCWLDCSFWVGGVALA